jgi:predicted transcriptional regulator
MPARNQPLSESAIRTIRELWEAGHNRRTIAREVGCSMSTVSRHAKGVHQSSAARARIYREQQIAPGP